MGLLWRSWDFPGGLVVKSSPFNAGGAGSIPCWGAQIPNALQPNNQNVRQRQYCNKLNKDLKKWSVKKKKS